MLLLVYGDLEAYIDWLHPWWSAALDYRWLTQKFLNIASNSWQPASMVMVQSSIILETDKESVAVLVNYQHLFCFFI